jgi:hypothetical protein
LGPAVPRPGHFFAFFLQEDGTGARGIGGDESVIIVHAPFSLHSLHPLL